MIYIIHTTLTIMAQTFCLTAYIHTRERGCLSRSHSLGVDVHLCLRQGPPLSSCVSLFASSKHLQTQAFDPQKLNQLSVLYILHRNRLPNRSAREEVSTPASCRLHHKTACWDDTTGTLNLLSISGSKPASGEVTGRVCIPN